MPQIRLQFLGPPRLSNGPTSVDLGAVKAIALLAYLAANRTAPSREQLLSLLWPDSPADAARKTLRNRLWTIRKLLGDDVLQIGDDHLTLAGSVWTDVRQLETAAEYRSGLAAADLQSATDLYRGPFLDGLALGDAPEFEIWLVAEQERYGQLYLRLLAQLVEAHCTAGNWPELIATAQRALAHDNLQEPMHRVLMEAYARAGERAGAMRQYETLRTVLKRELGVEPLAESAALRAAIASGQIQPRDKTSGASPARVHASPALPAEPPFVGREAELSALNDELGLALKGETRLVVLSGEVGIGKTRTWREWTRRHTRDLLILETHCLESTRALPFAPLALLLQGQEAASRLFTPATALSPIWLAEIARLLPEAQAVLGDRAAGPYLEIEGTAARNTTRAAPAGMTPRTLSSLLSEEERLRLLEAFTQCVRALSRQPLVIGIDDLHWADSATLDWLDYLLHRRLKLPLLLVATNRSEDTSQVVLERMAAWIRAGHARRLSLSRLSKDESAQLIASLLGDAGMTEQMQMQSAGNPFFLVELCRAAPGDVPSLLVELIRARLSHLPDSARQVAQAAAVLEGYCDFNALRRTSGRGEEETLDALDALLQAAVLVEREQRYVFAHPLVGSIVRGGLSGARSAFLHRRAAEALEVIHSRQLAQIAGPLANHYAQAGESAPAAKFAEMAGARAFSLGAPSEAVVFYRQALAHEPTPARRLGLGHALEGINDVGGARAAYEAAPAEYAAQGDRRGAARACLSLSDFYVRSGRTAEVIEWAEKSLSFVDNDDPEALAYAHAMLGAGRLRSEHGLDAAEHNLLEAHRLAEAHGFATLLVRSQFALGNLAAQEGDLREAIRAYEAALGSAHDAGEQSMEVFCHNNIAYHQLLLNELEPARVHIDTALFLAASRALRLPLPWLYSTRGELALAEREWDEAEGWFRRGLAEAEALGNLEQQANLRTNLGLAARARGHLDEALELLNVAHEGAGRIAAIYLQTKIDLYLAELHFERGERLAAKEALARAVANLRGGGSGRLQAWAERLQQTFTATNA